MRFCYIGHRCHGRSKSTVFLLELLREIGDVDLLDSDPDADASDDDDLVERVTAGGYDCLVFLQTEYLAARLRPLVDARFVIMPMFDGAAGRPDAFWRQFVHATFVSFCRSHHEHLDALGCRSHSFQYFTAPRSIPERDFANPTAFFWERRPDTAVNLSCVVALCRRLRVESLHVHTAPDFERLARTPTRNIDRIDGVSITRSRWFENQKEYDAIARAPLFFFAPRLQEGIGLTVLEAMSVGQIVVAPDRPTVNEYVSHGTTGILYDPTRPSMTLSLDEKKLERMSIAAQQKIAFGRADWLADTRRLKSLLLDDGRRWSTRDVSSHFMNALRTAASHRAFDEFGSTGEADEAS